MKIKDYLETKKRITEISYVINDRLKNLDGWVCPTIPSSAGPVSSFNSVSKIAEWNRINTSNTRPGNLFNQCGISLPIIGQETGLPLGFQIMCKSLDDEKMLKIACLIEKIICNQPSLELE
jgi:aspartyl-tRNA(Asn)/glutamyl-tRNA(Gln) amidotransferase subunit A